MERTCQLQSLHTRLSGKKNLKLHSPKLKQAMFSFKKMPPWKLMKHHCRAFIPTEDTHYNREVE